MLALAIPCPRQTGPTALASRDSGFDPAGVHVPQRPAFANVLQASRSWLIGLKSLNATGFLSMPVTITS